MANKNFKARIGIEAPLIAADNGTTAITLTGADVAVAGDLTIGGNDIKASDGTTALSLTNTTGSVSVAGDLFVFGNEIFSSGGNRNLTFSGTDVITESDLIVNGNDIKGLGGATAITLSGADVAVAGDLTVTGNDIKSSSATAITLSGANVAVVGTLDVQGGTITDSTGALQITSGATNTNITLAPNGSGDIVTTFSNGGNLTNNRNYVSGVIRNATTESIGDIWALNSTGPSSPYRGISIDNSADTARGPGMLIRSHAGASGGGNAARSRIIFEKARGTAASPAAVSSGDLIGSFDATGYTSTGWINDNVTPIVPLTFLFSAAETWVSNTNLGTTFTLTQSPTATTITSSANNVQTLTINPQTSASRSDAFTWANGKTGTTQTMALDVSGNLTVTGDVRVNGNDIRSSGNTSQIIMSSAGATLELRGDNIQLENAAGTSIVGGQISYGRQYIEAYSTQDQTNPTANAENLMSFNNTGISNGISIVTNGTTLTRITMSNAGLYNIQFSAQLSQTSGGNHNAFIWLKKNGTAVANTAGDVKVAGNGDRIMASWNYIVSAAAGDYYELAWAATDTSVVLDYVAAASPVPAIPSVILTVVPVGA